MFAADSAVPQSAQYLLGGGFIAVLVTSSIITARLINLSNRSVKAFVEPAERRMLRLERDNRICNRRMALLIEHLQRHNVPVPAYIWSLPEVEEPLLPEDEEDDIEGGTVA